MNNEQFKSSLLFLAWLSLLISCIICGFYEIPVWGLWLIFGFLTLGLMDKVQL